MGLFSNLKSNFTNVGANISSRFNQIVNSSNISNNPLSLLNISKSSVSLNLGGGGGISHATDLKQKMSQIEWSRGYGWDVHISPEPPAPFDSKSFGIPVVEVQADFALFGESMHLQLSNSTYYAPHRKNLFDIKLHLLDDENCSMEQYFEQWQNQVYGWDGSEGLRGTINYLDQSVRQIDITKLNSRKEEVFTRSYLVYPENNMMTFDNSTGSVRTFTINLVVAGYLGKVGSKSILPNPIDSISYDLAKPRNDYDFSVLQTIKNFIADKPQLSYTQSAIDDFIYNNPGDTSDILEEIENNTNV